MVLWSKIEYLHNFFKKDKVVKLCLVGGGGGYCQQRNVGWYPNNVQTIKEKTKKAKRKKLKSWNRKIYVWLDSSFADLTK